MRKTKLFRSGIREIRGSLGRYLAILAIVALGVGFFSGLRVTKSAMLETGNEFVSSHNMFDYRLVCTLGYAKTDVERFGASEGVRQAEGAVSADLLCLRDDGSEYVLRAHSITDDINRLELKEGRLPQAPDECLADAWSCKSDSIGTKVTLSPNNTEATLDMMSADSYTIVGLVYSPYYLNFERGSTSVGNGQITSYIYLPAAGFDSDGIFTEVFVTLDKTGYIYSKQYNQALDDMADTLKNAAEEGVRARYSSLLSEYEKGVSEYEASRSEYDEMISKLPDLGIEISELTRNDLEASLAEIDAMLAAPEYQSSMAQLQLTASRAGIQAYLDNFDDITGGEKKLDDAKAELDDAKAKLDDAAADIADKSASFALDRRTNIGYVCFENDSNIVEGISKVFPVFFILVAALVCSTTMSRMVDEQRTQIGVLRALGYSEGDIMFRYVFYSGSSALLGCIGGFIGGSFLFPFVIWKVYDIMYGFADIIFVFNLPLALISLAVALVCSVGVTVISCRREFSQLPAELIRPKAPKAGKRVFLEFLMPHIWRRMKFLHKVSARNILRYKKRLVMMILGIGGCTALLLTGFGIRDSITNIVGTQFGEITVYDGNAYFRSDMSADDRSDFESKLPDGIDSLLFTGGGTVECAADASRQISLVVTDGGNIDGFFNLTDGNKKLSYAGIGETVISDKLASKLRLKTGDSITLRWDSVNEITLKISGIFDNYIYDYAFVTQETYTALTGAPSGIRSVYFNLVKGADPHTVTAAIQSDARVVSATSNADIEVRFKSMLKSLDYIVMLVTGCAAALALIVLYNLANINITERIREIATIKVLGFNRGETAQYVFRENLVLTGFGVFFGIFGGIALHAYVMSQIDINIVKFDVRISPWSYVIAILLTFLFAYLVNLLLQIKLNRIDMAESLKSVE